MKLDDGEDRYTGHGRKRATRKLAVYLQTHPGECAVCEQPINVGDPTNRFQRDGFVHVRCAGGAK